MEMNAATQTPLSLEQLRARLPRFCEVHDVARLEVFGSIARGEGVPGSDVDLLVTFRPRVHPGIAFFGLADEAAALLGCKVDLLTRRSVEQDPNIIRRRSIRESVRDVYAA
jgi:uncharacterized protein